MSVANLLFPVGKPRASLNAALKWYVAGCRNDVPSLGTASRAFRRVSRGRTVYSLFILACLEIKRTRGRGKWLGSLLRLATGGVVGQTSLCSSAPEEVDLEMLVQEPISLQSNALFNTNTPQSSEVDGGGALPGLAFERSACRSAGRLQYTLCMPQWCRNRCDLKRQTSAASLWCQGRCTHVQVVPIDCVCQHDMLSAR